MIRVRAYLVPYGHGAEELLGELEIWNDTTGSSELGNYGVMGRTLPPEHSSRARLVDPVEEVTAEVKAFPRKSKHVWHLVTEALANLKWSES